MAALCGCMLMGTYTGIAGETPKNTNAVTTPRLYNGNSDDIGGTHLFLGFALGYSAGKTIIAEKTEKGGGFSGCLEFGVKIPMPSRTTEFPSALSVSASIAGYSVKERAAYMVTAPILYNKYFAWKNSAAIFGLAGINANYMLAFGSAKENFKDILNPIVVDPCVGIGVNQPLHLVDRRTGRTMFNGRVSYALVFSYTVMDALKGPNEVKAFYGQFRYNYIF